jgi:hypothetical protein
VQGVEEIVEIEEAILKEVAVAKVASQNFISAWKSSKQT